MLAHREKDFLTKKKKEFTLHVNHSLIIPMFETQLLEREHTTHSFKLYYLKKNTQL